MQVAVGGSPTKNWDAFQKMERAAKATGVKLKPAATIKERDKRLILLFLEAKINAENMLAWKSVLVLLSML